MIRISEVLLSFVLNSAWQIVPIAAVAAVGARLLKNAPARFRHALWIAALIMNASVPVLTVVSATAWVSNISVATPDSGSAPVGSAVTVAEPPANLSGEAASSAHLVSRRPVVNAPANTLSFLAIAYLLFIAYRLARLVRLWRRKEALRRSVSPIELTPDLEATIRRCRSAFQLSNVRLGCSRAIMLPATLGARRPLIVLPGDYASEMNEEALLSIVGHEMAHVARRDYVTNMICELISLPVSFHPVTYLIKAQIGRTRELACDELVTARVLGREAYARALVRVANISSTPTQDFVLSIFDGNILEERIMKLTQPRRWLRSPTARAILCAGLAALCLSALAISTISFELRTQAAAHATEFLAMVSAAEPASPQATLEMAPTVKTQTASPQSSSSADELARAACAAGRRNDLEMIPKLIEMLGDDRKTELIQCWADGSWNPALNSFKQPSPGEQAAIALASMGRPAFEPLARQLSNSNTVVRRNAAWAIGELHNMRTRERIGAVPQLISLLGDADEWVRMAAARALGELRDERAGDQLIARLGDSDWRVRELAAWALSEMKDKRAVTALCNVLLSDRQVEVRRMAAEALGEIRSADAIPSLRQALNDSETRVRAKSGWAIAEIEDHDG